MKKYYLDTSIWLDLFENRNEPNFPKGEWAKTLIKKIIENDDKIVYSDINIVELNNFGYEFFEIEGLFEELKQVLVFVESNDKEVKLAENISVKRNVPKGDVLHAIIARNNKATLITFDKHFTKLSDITEAKTPQEIIYS